MKNNWILKILILTFFLSLVFSGLSNLVAESFNEVILVLIIFFVTGFGIVFDMFGVAVLTSKEANFHAMASKKVKGSKEAIILIKNSANIATIFNDVIGDICGIISGSLAAVFTVYLVGAINLNSVIIAMIVTAVTSTFTVTGKAYMKIVAMKNSDLIVLNIGKVLSLFSKKWFFLKKLVDIYYL